VATKPRLFSQGFIGSHVPEWREMLEDVLCKSHEIENRQNDEAQKADRNGPINRPIQLSSRSPRKALFQ
jgi:hypothetical protein